MRVIQPGNGAGMKVIDLLNKFNGPYRIYEAERTAAGILLDYIPVASSESTEPIKAKYRKRQVHDFTGCEGYGINIYLA